MLRSIEERGSIKMEKEKFIVTTTIENILINEWSVLELLVTSAQDAFVLKTGDKTYCKITTGAITSERSFTLYMSLILSCFVGDNHAWTCFKLPIEVKNYEITQHSIYLDNKNSRMIINSNKGIREVNYNPELSELQTQDGEYPVITGLKFEVVIERPL